MYSIHEKCGQCFSRKKEIVNFTPVLNSIDLPFFHLMINDQLDVRKSILYSAIFKIGIISIYATNFLILIYLIHHFYLLKVKNIEILPFKDLNY